MEFWTSLIKTPENNDFLSNNCTRVTGPFWIFEGEIECLTDVIPSVEIIAEGAVPCIGDLTEEELIKGCVDWYGVEIIKENFQFTKEDISAFFNHNSKIKVIFTKKDGSERTMLCTRDFNAIPKEHRPADKENVDRPGNPAPDHLFSVFDLQANGWRSFTIANIISIQPTA